MTAFTKRELQKRAVSLNTGTEEIMIFGIFHMARHGFPRIKMCWASKTKVPMISQKITMNRLKNSVKIVYNLDVTEERKRKDSDVHHSEHAVKSKNEKYVFS